MINENDAVMLSTYDNPYSPFDDSFNLWFMYDAIVLKHNTCGLLAMEACTNDLASDEVNDLYTRMAMERIVEREPMIYRIVTREDYATERPLVTVGGGLKNRTPSLIGGLSKNSPGGDLENA